MPHVTAVVQVAGWSGFDKRQGILKFDYVQYVQYVSLFGGTLRLSYYIKCVLDILLVTPCTLLARLWIRVVNFLHAIPTWLRSQITYLT
jgi:hypothetical protein